MSSQVLKLARLAVRHSQPSTIYIHTMASSQDRPSTHIPLQNGPGATTERPTTDFQPALPTETAPATEVTTPSQQGTIHFEAFLWR